MSRSKRSGASGDKLFLLAFNMTLVAFATGMLIVLLIAKFFSGIG